MRIPAINIMSPRSLKKHVILLFFLIMFQAANIHSAEEGEEGKTDPIYSMNATDLIKYYGFTPEVHHVRSENYRLELHRIRTESPSTGFPVFVQHAIFFSSSSFLINEPTKALVYMLASRGYDVWLGNSRGNTYSRFSYTISPESVEFWAYGLDEMIKEDMPRVIDYILETTQHKELICIGHSTGAAQIFGLLALRPEYNSKVAVVLAISPAVFLNDATGVLVNFSRDCLNDPELVADEVLPRSNRFANMALMILSSPLAHTALNMIKDTVGDSYGTEPEAIDVTLLPQYAVQLTEGLSERTLLHFAQATYIDTFQMFDFGSETNKQLYNQETPPAYDLSLVTAPTYIFTAQNDIIGTLRGNEKLANSIANCKYYLTVGNELTGHVFLLWTTQAIIHQQIIDFMETTLVEANLIPKATPP